MNDHRFEQYDHHGHLHRRHHEEQHEDRGEQRGDQERRGATHAGPPAGPNDGTDLTPERDVPGGTGGAAGSGDTTRVGPPVASGEDPGGFPATAPATQRGPGSSAPAHHVLESLLGAWALAACAAEETTAVEEHLGGCGACAEEALRLRNAVGLLQRPESLDLDLRLRTHVLESCLRRRPPRVPVPEWAAAYDAETARLDALLQDFGDTEWHAPVRRRRPGAADPTSPSRRTTVAGAVTQLMAGDRLVAASLGLTGPPGTPAPGRAGPPAHAEAFRGAARLPPTRSVRAPWRAQTHDLLRTASFPDSGAERMPVSYGGHDLSLHDAMLNRAFECWVYGEDIAEAVHYPYEPPTGRHLHGIVDLAARMLPTVLEARRQAGQEIATGRRPVTAGAPGRSLRLEIEGAGGGEWLIPLDSPAAAAAGEHEVARIALDGSEFCHLAAGRVSPQEAAAGQVGDRAAIRDVLLAAASISRI